MLEEEQMDRRGEGKGLLETKPKWTEKTMARQAKTGDDSTKVLRRRVDNVLYDTHVLELNYCTRLCHHTVPQSRKLVGGYSRADVSSIPRFDLFRIRLGGSLSRKMTSDLLVSLGCSPSFHLRLDCCNLPTSIRKTWKKSLT